MICILGPLHNGIDVFLLWLVAIVAVVIPIGHAVGEISELRRHRRELRQELADTRARLAAYRDILTAQQAYDLSRRGEW